MSMIPPIIPFIGKPETKKYRILEPGEVIQEGDEFDDGTNLGSRWIPAGDAVGDKVIYGVFRRLVK